MKKAECWRVDAFELPFWRRLLRVPWTARRSNQSILKEISPGCSLEGLMLKLKLHYFGHLMWSIDSLEMTLILGGIRGRRRRGRQRMRWLDGITDLMDVGVGDGQGVLGAITGDPTHDKVMWERPHEQGLSGLEELLDLLEHLPQNQNLSVLLFCAIHQLFWH